MESDKLEHSNDNLDWLIKQTFEEFKQNMTLIDRLHITFTHDNFPILLISFGKSEDYETYVKLYDDNHVEHANFDLDICCIGFCFDVNIATIFKVNIINITPEWIIQNLPPNVLSIDYNRMCKQIYLLDNLPIMLDLLEITEYNTPSDLSHLPLNLTKLNLWKCNHLRYCFTSLPQNLKILILPAESCYVMSKVYRQQIYHDNDDSNFKNRIVCYERLKFNNMKQIRYFFRNDYNKYNKAFDKHQNVFDKFLKDTFLRKRKRYFKNKYDYSKTGWNYLATCTEGTYKVNS